jgi:hypothetical protein
MSFEAKLGVFLSTDTGMNFQFVQFVCIDFFDKNIYCAEVLYENDEASKVPLHFINIKSN